MQKDLALLGLYAHPDDEQLSTGTLAQCASEGIRTGLVSATRGEAGQIHESVTATRDTVGKVREAELRSAAVVVGVKDLWFLDYRDSGWVGSPDNDWPDSFNKCERQQALGRIVKIIRAFRPTVIMTFDPTGGYGHLDHLMIHSLAIEAFSAASNAGRFPEAGEPWQTSRLYYSMFPRSLMRRMAEHLRTVSPDDEFLKLDTNSFGMDDSELTNEIDVSRWVDLKDKSLSCHQTQRADYQRWHSLPPNLLTDLRATEYFALALGEPLPKGPEARGDLFAGLR